MSIYFTDSHAHLSASPLFEQIDDILKRAQQAGVDRILNICTDAQNLTNGLNLAAKNPWIYNAAAVHPHDAQQYGVEYFPIVQQHARDGKLVAIGETGLDYHYHHSTPEVQQNYLRKHFQLAIECKLPIIIHCREAFDDFFKILDSEYVVNGRHAPGVLHCFTGTMNDAHKVLERGWYLSMSGVVTFKKSNELREIAEIVPLDQLLIETDAPYLAPQSHRGKQNEPAYVVETAEVIANVKQIPLSELVQATSNNFSRMIQKI